MSTVKLSLHISDEANELMEEACQQNLLTKSEFMRRAMALMIYTMNYKKKGAHLAVLDKDDKKIADVVGI